jgi:pyruvate formate lyase activating enzyme
MQGSHKESTVQDWRSTSTTASHYEVFDHKGKPRVKCNLCPRHCLPANGKFGFCGVRGNIDGQLRSFNFGKSVPATEELIETEAVNHFSPGARILSLGNVGCSLSCSFCQNWETSQTNHLSEKSVRYYTPESVIQICKDNNIDIISWTYNDPVVWHEFVMITSKLARENGIKTLYKSAFYIEMAPVLELIEVIDIFSLSLKSMNPEFYRKQSKGELQPTLDVIKAVYDSGAHLEISQLVIPELNDHNDDIEKTVDWVLGNLDRYVPLHFVGFHPAYKYTHVERTPLSKLEMAYEISKEKGIEYCYLGNVYKNGASDTHCKGCQAKLVTRFGLKSKITNLDQQGICTQCGVLSPIKHVVLEQASVDYPDSLLKGLAVSSFEWSVESNSIHLSVSATQKAQTIYIKRRGYTEKRVVGNGLERILLTRHDGQELGVEIYAPEGVEFGIFPILDRAHFPVNDVNNAPVEKSRLEVRHA